MTEFDKALFKLRLSDPSEVPKLTELLLRLRDERRLRFSKGWTMGTLVPALIYFGIAVMYLFAGKPDWTMAGRWTAFGVFFLLLGLCQMYFERRARMEELVAQVLAELVAQNNQLRREIDLIATPSASTTSSQNQ